MFHIQCEMNNNAHKKAKYGDKEFLSYHRQESHLLVSKKSIRYAVLLGFQGSATFLMSQRSQQFVKDSHQKMEIAD